MLGEGVDASRFLPARHYLPTMCLIGMFLKAIIDDFPVWIRLLFASIQALSIFNIEVDFQFAAMGKIWQS